MKYYFDLLKTILLKMFEKSSMSLERNSLGEAQKPETIQDIAVKLVQQQLQTLQLENSQGPKERTVFILGSKAVVGT